MSQFAGFLTGLLAAMQPWILPIGALVLFACGAYYAASMGDQRAKAQAKGGIIAAVVGMFIMEAATTLATQIQALPH